jgi:dihydrofolate reductase
MSRLRVVNNVTLDGVVQSPGHPDEDRRGGFEHGGWAAPYVDEVMGRTMGQGVAQGGALLFGRLTYEKMEAAWRDGPEDSPFTAVMNERRKYVASTTLEGPLDWQNSTLLEGDVAEAVAKLKEQPGGNTVILGSGELVRSLMPHDLIDELVLSIHPLVLGSALRLFADAGPFRAFTLVDSVTTTTGVIIATYQPS